MTRAKRKETPDSGLGAVRGLYLIEQPSGKESWAFRYRFAGRPSKFTFGPISRKEARVLAHKAIYDLANDIDPAAKRRALRAANRKAKPANLDLVEIVAAQFLKRHCGNLKPATQREAGRYMSKIVTAWRGRALSSITRPMIHALLDSISDSGFPVAANRTLAWMNNLCNWAISRGLLEANPCVGIHRPATETARARILSDEELAAVLKAAEALEPPCYGAFVMMMVLTGQRRTEVSGLVWSEIDFDKKIWVLPPGRAKNGKAHEIPLSNATLAILNALPRLCDFVFSSTGRGPIRGHDQIKKTIDKLTPDIPAWTFHDIRRTFASGCARLGVALPTIEKLLNHVGGSFAGVAGIYRRHTFADEKRLAVESWSRHVEGLMTGKANSNIVPMRGRS
jgi:integrase